MFYAFDYLESWFSLLGRFKASVLGVAVGTISTLVSRWGGADALLLMLVLIVPFVAWLQLSAIWAYFSQIQVFLSQKRRLELLGWNEGAARACGSRFVSAYGLFCLFWIVSWLFSMRMISGLAN